MAITLESLQHGQTLEPPRVLLYGVPGVGKSTWASDSPKPVFIFTEKGKGRLSVSNFPLAKSWDDVKESLQALLTEEHEFQTVVIDTIDWLEKLIFEKVCADHAKDSIEDFGYGKGYTHALNYWGRFFDLLDRLNEERQMAVILIGHSIVKLFNSPNTENYDQYQLNIHAKAAAMVKEWADCVLFANYDVKVKVVDEGFGKTKGKAVKMTNVPRMVHTEERPAFWAKNRYNLPDVLPLAWSAFEEAMAAGIEEQQEVIAQIKKEKAA